MIRSHCGVSIRALVGFDAYEGGGVRGAGGVVALEDFGAVVLSAADDLVGAKEDAWRRGRHGGRVSDGDVGGRASGVTDVCPGSDGDSVVCVEVKPEHGLDARGGVDDEGGSRDDDADKVAGEDV